MDRLPGATERLDGPLDPSTLEGNLRDLARVNRWLGGVSLTWRALMPLLEAHPDRPSTLLDVGTGGGDIPHELLRRSAGRHDLVISATDVRPEIVAIAARRSGNPPAFAVSLSADQRIAAGDGTFDYVHSSLLLHHLDPPAAVTMLRDMARVARVAVLVNDLDRGRHWLLGARLLSRVATRNSYTRHDAPLSVRRAYRPAEVVQLAESAGLAAVARYAARPPYRYVITFRHASAR